MADRPGAPGPAGPANGLTDVAGVLVGHHHADRAPFLTGTTVVLVPEGARAGVVVRGGAPGTRETDALEPDTLVAAPHAIVLTGGSAYGLEAATGVVSLLEERGIGFPAGDRPGEVVPVVPAAVLFDLGRGGAWGARPDASFGYRAAAGASSAPVPEGCVGAGTGAVVGSLKGGTGTASVTLAGGVRVAALVALNAAGEAVDPSTGVPWAVGLGRSGEFDGLVAPSAADVARAPAPGRRPPGTATTIGVVATDAPLDRAEVRRLAATAHDGLARAVRPAHTLVDGDTLFALATGGDRPVPGDRAGWGSGTGGLSPVVEAGADCVALAVVHALLAARGAGAVPAYRDAYPSAFPRGGEGR